MYTHYNPSHNIYVAHSLKKMYSASHMKLAFSWYGSYVHFAAKQSACSFVFLVLQRYYSISSSPNLYPGQVHITVAVVDYQVKPFARQEHNGQQNEGLPQEKKTRRHLGVCSNWLSRIELGTTVPCYFRK